MDEAQPDAIHIATEGPLGWAARRHCLRRGWPFTTAFHTRFPEMLQLALGVPTSWGYALLRRFHRPSRGVMVPTAGVRRLLEQRGFANLRDWTHGVDTQLFRSTPSRANAPGWGISLGPVSLFVGRVSHEKNIQAFLELGIPGSKVVCGVGPLEQALRDRYPGVHWLGLLARRELAEVYAAADVFVFPSLLGDLRPGDAGGHGHGPARGRLPGGRPAGGAGPTPPPARCTPTCARPAAPGAAPCAATRRASPRAGLRLGAGGHKLFTHCHLVRLPALSPGQSVTQPVIRLVDIIVTDEPANRAPPAVTFLDRDHSILAFNERVLDWARRERRAAAGAAALPVHRLQSNLDEFFEVRMAPHLTAFNANEPQAACRPADGYVRAERPAAHELVAQQYAMYNDELLPLLQKHGIELVSHGDRDAAQRNAGSRRTSSARCSRC